MKKLLPVLLLFGGLAFFVVVGLVGFYNRLVGMSWVRRTNGPVSQQVTPRCGSSSTGILKPRQKRSLAAASTSLGN